MEKSNVENKILEKAVEYHNKAMLKSQEAEVAIIKSDKEKYYKLKQEAIQYEYQAVIELKENYESFTAQLILKSLLFFFWKLEEWHNVIYFGYYIKDYLKYDVVYFEVENAIKEAEKFLNNYFLFY